MKRFLLIIISLLNFYFLAGNEKLEIDDIFGKSTLDPEFITNYSVDELTKSIKDREPDQSTSFFIYLNPTSIRRSTLRNYYLPLCECLLEHYYLNYDILQCISKGRGFPKILLVSTDSLCAGKDLIKRYCFYQNIFKELAGLHKSTTVTSLIYGKLRFLEYNIWGETPFMDKIDPIPNELIQKVCNLAGNDDFFDIDLILLIQRHSNDADWIFENARFLLKTLSYSSEWQLGCGCGLISSIYITNTKQEELKEILKGVFYERFGSDYMKKLWPIFSFHFTSILDLAEGAKFENYRDSLLSRDYEYAKYLPHKCPDNLKESEGYNEYNNQFYSLISYVFEISKGIPNPNMYFNYQFYHNIFECSDYNEFLDLYVNETLKRFYDERDFTVWEKIEEIADYLKTSSYIPISIILDISDCYAPINPKKSKEILTNTSVTDWIEESMRLPSDSISDGHLVVAASIAQIYASLYNELRFPYITRLVNWVENNYSKIKKENDRIVYNIAYALYLMDSYEESLKWIKRINVKKSEYKQEFLNLLLKNYYSTDNYKEVLRIASQLEFLDYSDMIRILLCKLSQNKDCNLEEWLEHFSASLASTYSIMPIFSTDDQDWAFRKNKNLDARLLEDLVLEYFLKDFIGDKSSIKFKPFIAAILYNWSLASKGVLLRSQKLICERVLSQMDVDNYNYFHEVISYDSDDSTSNTVDDNINKYVSEKAKYILLNYLRKDTTTISWDYDYTHVKKQLKGSDIAIEIAKLEPSFYVCSMIKKDWDYPQFVELITSDETNLGECLWSCISPFLTEGQRIYISLDGAFLFENIEFVKDEDGNYMSDKYEICRVSTTADIPSDIYISDISDTVVFGNLTYSGSETSQSTDISQKDKTKGAMNKAWVELPESEEEVECIQKLMDNLKIPCKQYQKEVGDKQAFLSLSKDSVNLLHLSTHGFYDTSSLQYDDEIPAMKRSGIVLSGSGYDMVYRKDSGTVFANEIANMDLNSVKLLVLSACETALGALDDDGVLGLQRGFKQAGVGCIIMSLKEVNVFTTTELMKSFYKYFGDGLSAREAFKKAQSEVSKFNYTDDWKAFILID